MSEPTASSTAVTVSSLTLTFNARNSLPDEVGPFAGLGDPRARMHLRTKLFQLIRQRLGTPAAGVHHDQHGARRQVGGGGPR